MGGRARKVSVWLLAVALVGTSPGAEVVGWRGDGSGCFPGANPPTEWRKVSRVLGGLRCSSERPAGEAPAGTPACTGAVTEWLVLGPLPLEADAGGIDAAFVEEEAAWRPAAGESVGGVSWRKVTTPGHTLDFSALFAKDNPAAEWVPYHELHVYKAPFAAYACSYLYAAAEGTVLVRVRMKKEAKLWLNGELIFPSKKAMVVQLKKGWNRLLVKAVNTVHAEKPGVWTNTDYPSWWYLDLSLTATWPFETETRNIRWATEMPSHGVAGPVVVGERVFVLAEPGRVICVDKRTGKLLWDRAPSFWDTLSVKERGDAAFAEAAALAKRLEEIRGVLAKGGAPAPELGAERDALVGKIAGALKQVDAERFTVKPSGHGNCLGTPVSDGRSVFVALGNGLAARYALDGTLKWATLVSPGRNQEHGVTSSPALAGDRLIVFHIDLAALDIETGEIAWKTNIWRQAPFYGDLTHQTPVTFRVDGKPCVYLYGEIIRVADGEVVWDGKHAWKEKQAIPTPIVVDGVLYDVTSSGRARRAKLPTAGGEIVLEAPVTGQTFSRVIGAATRGFACASPLYVDGLVYVVDAMGNLFVLDATTLEVVCRRDLGIGFETRSAVHIMGIAYASPVYAGKHVYVFGMDGTTVVLKPGRACEEVARNKIEDMTWPNHWRQKPEGFASTPAADGDCLYVRGDKYLYCIGR